MKKLILGCVLFYSSFTLAVDCTGSSLTVRDCDRGANFGLSESQAFECGLYNCKTVLPSSGGDSITQAVSITDRADCNRGEIVFSDLYREFQNICERLR